jgi:hypothetical protein
MAVLLGGTSVLICIDHIRKEPNGWKTFEAIIPNGTFCSDGEVARVAFQNEMDRQLFMNELDVIGLRRRAAVTAFGHPIVRRSWLETGGARLSDVVTDCAWLKGSRQPLLYVPLHEDVGAEDRLTHAVGDPSNGTQYRLGYSCCVREFLI